MDKELEIVKKRKFNRDISWEEIGEKLKQINNKLSKYYGIIFYIIIASIVLFTFAKVIKNNTNYYRNDLSFRWGTVLSYDDVYHANDIYSDSPNYEKMIGTIVKHPFISAFGQLTYKIESMLFDNAQKTDHYFHIVVLQILINAIGIFYLYKILREQYGIKEKWCFLLLTIYQLATVTLLGTLIIDSFIISGTLLIMSYYYLSKQKLVISSILGILVTGFCITNSIAFAIMAIFLLKKKRDIVKVGVSCILGFLLVALLLPYREYFFDNLFSEVHNQADIFSANEGDTTLYLKRVFYFMLISPIFFLNIVSFADLNEASVIIFDFSTGILIIAAVVIFFAFIIFNLVRNIKDRNMLAAFGVFIYNMFIHVVMKYGLSEGTIFGLHFLFAEILMFAFGFKIKNVVIRRIFICFAILLLLLQIRNNLDGLLNCVLLFKDWT